jgi:hypothetical protein
MHGLGIDKQKRWDAGTALFVEFYKDKDSNQYKIRFIVKDGGKPDHIIEIRGLTEEGEIKLSKFEQYLKNLIHSFDFYGKELSEVCNEKFIPH